MKLPWAFYCVFSVFLKVSATINSPAMFDCHNQSFIILLCVDIILNLNELSFSYFSFQILWTTFYGDYYYYYYVRVLHTASWCCTVHFFKYLRVCVCLSVSLLWFVEDSIYFYLKTLRCEQIANITRLKAKITVEYIYF